MIFLLDVKILCVGKVVVLRGYDGKLLWKVDVYFEIFVINCYGIDVMMDGIFIVWLLCRIWIMMELEKLLLFMVVIWLFLLKYEYVL